MKFQTPDKQELMKVSALERDGNMLVIKGKIFGAMPMTARMHPSRKPEASSRRITRHQSRSSTSCKAIARMISEVACEPELPPLEMISGRKSASTSAFASSS